MSSVLKLLQRSPNKYVFNKLYHYSNRTIRTLNQLQFHPLTHIHHNTFPNKSFHRSISTTKDKDDDQNESEEQREESDESEEDIESDESEEENQQITELESKVQEIESELNKFRDALARSQAEKINIQNMNKKDVESARKFATKNFSKDMLAVADSLNGCIDAIDKHLSDYKDDENIKSVIDGVKVTQSTLIDTFARHGVKKIKSLHQEFDPNYHEALFKMPTSEHPPNHVIQVISEGYTLKDTALRAAKVGISVQPPQETEETGDIEETQTEEDNTDNEDKKE